MYGMLLNIIPENNRIERIWLMAKFDFLTRYYGSFLGLFWALLKPLFQLAIYYIVFTKVFVSRTESFILFLFIGIILFQFFIESAQSSMKIFQTKKYLWENIQVNKLDVFYSATLATLLGFIFNFFAFLIFHFIFGGQISMSAFVFPLILINLLLLILAAQLILSTISIYIKDIQSLWFIIRTGLFWGSGILFDLENLGKKAMYINYVNPLAGIMTNTRNVLIYAKPPDWNLLFINLFVATILFLAGNWYFKKYSAKALEKL